jgi:transposase-like protein
MIYGKKSKEELYYRHEYKEKKRCPKCESLNTKKIGFINSKILTKRGEEKRKTQRFHCKDCKSSFTAIGYNKRKKVSNDLKKSAVIEYVTTKNSMSEVAARYGISKMSILNWLPEISEYYPKIDKIIEKKRLSGIILIDGKEIKIMKNRKVILIASDAISRKPIYYGVYNSENKENTELFLKELKEIYPIEIKGITSDFGRGKCFLGVIKSLLPNVPHQICSVHYLRYVWLFLPRTRRSKYFWRNKVLKWIIKMVINAKNREESIAWLNKFKSLIPFFKASYHKRFIRSLIKNYEYLTQHFENDFLPKTSNISECINRQLVRKLKNTDGFKSEKSLDSFLKIWFWFYIKNNKNRHN